MDAVSDLKNVEVAAVCDISPAKAEATAERFGIKIVDRFTKPEFEL